MANKFAICAKFEKRSIENKYQRKRGFTEF